MAMRRVKSLMRLGRRRTSIEDELLPRGEAGELSHAGSQQSLAEIPPRPASVCSQASDDSTASAAAATARVRRSVRGQRRSSGVSGVKVGVWGGQQGQRRSRSTGVTISQSGVIGNQSEIQRGQPGEAREVRLVIGQSNWPAGHAMFARLLKIQRGCRIFWTG